MTISDIISLNMFNLVGIYSLLGMYLFIVKKINIYTFFSKDKTSSDSGILVAAILFVYISLSNDIFKFADFMMLGLSEFLYYTILLVGSMFLSFIFGQGKNKYGIAALFLFLSALTYAITYQYPDAKKIIYWFVSGIAILVLVLPIPDMLKDKKT